MSRTVGVRELKAHASALLKQVEATGEEIVITVRGRPVARLERMSNGKVPAVDGMGSTRGIGRHILPKADWEDFMAVRRWVPKTYDDD